MTVMRYTPTRHIHLARAAHFAGEAFGHDPLSQGAIVESASAPSRSGLAAALMACLNSCRSGSHSNPKAGLDRTSPQNELKIVRRKRWGISAR